VVYWPDRFGSEPMLASWHPCPQQTSSVRSMKISLLASGLQGLSRILGLACLTLSLAVLWAQTRSETIRSAFNGLPLTLLFVGSLGMFAVSVALFGRSRRSALFGFLITIWYVFVGLLPTI
jgi:hypothetical protein